MEDGLLKTHAADVALPASSGFFGIGGAPGAFGLSGWTNKTKMLMVLMFLMTTVTWLVVSLDTNSHPQDYWLIPFWCCFTILCLCGLCGGSRRAAMMVAVAVMVVVVVTIMLTPPCRARECKKIAK